MVKLYLVELCLEFAIVKLYYYLIAYSLTPYMHSILLIALKSNIGGLYRTDSAKNFNPD